jgi:hypothetical protein
MFRTRDELVTFLSKFEIIDARYKINDISRVFHRVPATNHRRNFRN